MRKYRLEISVFLAGACLMVLEICGSRLLAPFLGASIFVWTSLIGVILASLSIGYWLGGRQADADPSYAKYSFLFLHAGISVAFVAPLHYLVLLPVSRLITDIRLSTLVGALCLFTVPGILLGMISPYAVRLRLTENARAGRTVGTLYAVSTVGSIAGTFLAGFFLIAYLGSSTMVLLLGLLLILTSLIVSLEKFWPKIFSLFICCALWIFFSYTKKNLLESGLRDLDTLYQRVMIVDAKSPGNVRMLVTDPLGTQSSMSIEKPFELIAAYLRYYDLAWHFTPGITHALMLGGGAYSYPRYFTQHYPDVNLDVVELDPGITELARTYFFLTHSPRLRIFHEDARTFLKKNKTPYQAIFFDVFSSSPTIPFHLSTVETVSSLYNALSSHGVVMMNMITGIDGPTGRFLRAEITTFKQIFPRVLLFTAERPNDAIGPQNLVLAAFKSPDQPQLKSTDQGMQVLLDNLWTPPIEADQQVLTDEFAPVEHLMLPALLEMQRRLHSPE